MNEKKKRSVCKKFKYNIKIQSKVFPNLFNIIRVNLFCYEKLFKKGDDNDLHCHEKINWNEFI